MRVNGNFKNRKTIDAWGVGSEFNIISNIYYQHSAKDYNPVKDWVMGSTERELLVVFPGGIISKIDYSTAAPDGVEINKNNIIGDLRANGIIIKNEEEAGLREKIERLRDGESVVVNGSDGRYVVIRLGEKYFKYSEISIGPTATIGISVLTGELGVTAKSLVNQGAEIKINEVGSVNGTTVSLIFKK